MVGNANAAPSKVSHALDKSYVMQESIISCYLGSGSVVAIPVYVRHNMTWLSGGTSGKLDITVGPKQTMGRQVEQVMHKTNKKILYKLPTYLINVSILNSEATL